MKKKKEGKEERKEEDTIFHFTIEWIKVVSFRDGNLRGVVARGAKETLVARGSESSKAKSNNHARYRR